MKNKNSFLRLMSLLLVFVLVGSLLPTAFAAEGEDGLPEETMQSATDPPEETTELETEQTESTTSAGTSEYGLEQWAERYAFLMEQESALNVEYVGDTNSLAAEEYSQISTFATGDTTSFLPWGWIRSAVLPSGVTLNFTYNGKSYSHTKMDLAAIDVNGDSKFSLDEAAYCIEPGTVINSETYKGEEKTGADAWGQLGTAKQEAIGLALLYGYPNGLSGDGEDNATKVTYQLATAIIVHEICLGWRSANAPYTRTDSTYWDKFYNNTVTWDGGIYSASVTGTVSKETLKYAYDYIADKMAKHWSTLSFASASQLSPPTHSMTQQSDGTYKVTLTDTNGVLADYTFPTISGVTFTKSGSTLTITAKNASSIPTTVIAPTRTVPSPDKSAYLIWNSSDGSDQEMLTLKAAVNGDPVPAYFKLEAPEGSLLIKKTTNTGKNLSGWQFNIYSDSACKNLVEGPVTSGSDGTISVTLAPGTYYVKEIAKSDPYWVCDTSVKAVTVSAGATATVTFANAQYGKIKIVKSMETDGPLEGWQFEVYRQEESGDPSSPLGTAISLKLVGTYTSAADGTILSDNLEPGTYVVQEIIPEDSLYYCETENPQTITVAAGETAQVFFTNALRPGKITVEKVNLQGEHLPGVKFLLEWSQDGTAWTPVVYSDNESVVLGGCTSEALVDGCLVTGADGFVTFEGLYPGIQYRLSEVEAPEGYVLLSDYAFQGELPAEDFTVTLTVVNASTFTLPMTGSNTLARMPIALALCMAVCVGALLYRRKK